MTKELGEDKWLEQCRGAANILRQFAGKVEEGKIGTLALVHDENGVVKVTPVQGSPIEMIAACEIMKADVMKMLGVIPLPVPAQEEEPRIVVPKTRLVQ